MESNYNKAKEILKTYNQSHVIPFLEDGKNTKLENEVLNMNFDNLKNLYFKTNEKEFIQGKKITPIFSINPNKMQEYEIKKYEDIGINIIKQSKFAVCTMAGRTGNKITDMKKQKEHIN